MVNIIDVKIIEALKSHRELSLPERYKLSKFIDGLMNTLINQERTLSDTRKELALEKQMSSEFEARVKELTSLVSQIIPDAILHNVDANQVDIIEIQKLLVEAKGYLNAK